ncbi:sugar phosphate nucleotidyltransferase [uncultured Lacinutrix sp.]|uniref:sugar phosphate nucleotidyltransferase n=1 Tax=uncultured Lacinutrix sp. TaxID=574032 RepID=UPI002614FF7A|nr:sugar phosphate nucleotidyltransferase [uncultured Lacinutrix sp.]
MDEAKVIAIMAAGLGTRFGSLKQLHTINSSNYSIMDFSIYDAMSVGFNTIVFIVRQETLSVFKKRYKNQLPKKITVKFVIQDDKGLYPLRNKPFGTGSALLSLKEIVKGNFALINADDFYGQKAFKLMYNNLYTNINNSNYFIGYQLENTLSKNGTVSRGECYIDSDSWLKKIIERTQIAKEHGVIFYNKEENKKTRINKNTIVSMNFWGFTTEVFKVAESEFEKFLKKEENIINNEFYITSIVDYSINKKLMQYKMLPTNSKWYGITYFADAEDISKEIKRLINLNVYPEILW